MASRKVECSKHSLCETRPAFSRSPVRSGSLIRSLAVDEAAQEENLLEQIGKVCLEYCQGYASQVAINSYQVVPPEAVSVVDPPEHVWLVRLYVVGSEGAQAAGEIEVIAVLRSGVVSLFLR